MPECLHVNRILYIHLEDSPLSIETYYYYCPNCHEWLETVILPPELSDGFFGQFKEALDE